jgi:hypothetical protein
MVVADLHGWHLIARTLHGLIDGVTDMECAACGEYLDVDLTDLRVDPDAPVPPDLAFLASLAVEAGAPDAAKHVRDLRGAIPCPECGEPLRPAQP